MDIKIKGEKANKRVANSNLGLHEFNFNFRHQLLRGHDSVFMAKVQIKFKAFLSKRPVTGTFESSKTRQIISKYDTTKSFAVLFSGKIKSIVKTNIRKCNCVTRIQ